MRSLVKMKINHLFENELIDYIADHLSTLGIPSQKIYSDDQNKANLYATIGPKVDGGIVLSGHTDVVPPGKLSDWTVNPFKPEIKNNYLTLRKIQPSFAPL